MKRHSDLIISLMDKDEFDRQFENESSLLFDSTDNDRHFGMKVYLFKFNNVEYLKVCSDYTWMYFESYCDDKFKISDFNNALNCSYIYMSHYHCFEPIYYKLNNYFDINFKEEMKVIFSELDERKNEILEVYRSISEKEVLGEIVEKSVGKEEIKRRGI